MLSFRAKATIFFVKKFFNINPLEGKDIYRMGKLATRDKFKLPKGYSRKRVILSNGVPMEVVDPLEKNEKNLIYVIHGGGYIVGMSDVYRNLAKRYSIAGGNARVVFIDYRLAPDNKFPDALEDALLGWEWILKSGYEPKNIAVIGDSAGGNLTLAMMLKLRELNKELPGRAVLISPWTDMTASGESYLNNFKIDALFGGKKGVTIEQKEDLLESKIYTYFKDEDRTNPLVSPIFASFDGFPKTLVLVGSREILLDDSLTIVEKMKKNNVPVQLHIGEGMFHIWPLFCKLFKEAENAMQHICEYIKDSYNE